ncbi:DEAD-domain-containing protein [Trichodelitschia bisporula]|uniref:RNA helicase n=1 Tax=Trichodelitschia bisporula TaxID=703511 RepID=A0A6G1I1Y1_9PEZI|nr:DEAD-domain-containing protein [Trichodelitschia bisporula]
MASKRVREEEHEGGGKKVKVVEETVVVKEKKVKKDKSEKKEKKEKSKKEKKDKKDKVSTESTPQDEPSHDTESLDTEAQRKAEKKAKKAAKAAKKAAKLAAEVTVEPAAVEPTETTDLDPMASYTQPAALTALPQSEIDAYLTTNQITMTAPGTTYRPALDFAYLTLPKALRAPLSGFSKPTPIQAAAWPYLLAGRDLVGVAETGSGKTLAFGLPAVRHIQRLDAQAGKRKGVRAVVVSPTRELASQIAVQLGPLAEAAGLTVACVYGGVPKDPQIAALKRAAIVVATPGRLNDLVSDGSADLSSAAFVVLDEADRMLDKGFEQDIRKILGATGSAASRQTVMFTATWPPEVRALAASFMRDTVRVVVGDSPDGELRANTRIEQRVEVVEPRAKEGRLVELLHQLQKGAKKDDRVLVFCLYKKEAARVESTLQRRGLKVAAIHGDLGQGQREQALEAFRSGQVRILVATDVAARGLDIPAVKAVVNVTFPLTVEDYVHRIGRTGRAGLSGLAITLFTEHDKALSGALINVLRAAKQPVPEELMKFGTTVKKKEHAAYGAFYKEVDETKKATKITFD